MRRVIVVKHKWENSFFVQLSVEVALDVHDLGFHGGIGLEEQVGVTLEQVAHVAFSSVGRVSLNQLLFLHDEVSAVLHDELGVSVENLNDI